MYGILYCGDRIRPEEKKHAGLRVAHRVHVYTSCFIFPSANVGSINLTAKEVCTGLFDHINYALKTN